MTTTRKIILKLGGSVITVKNKPYTPRVKTIKNIAFQLRNLIHEGHIELVGIVVGGGSYGHFTVSEFYGEKNYPYSEALYRITTSMTELALLVSDILAMYNIYTVIFPPHSFCKPRGIKPHCKWDYIDSFLSKNTVPLIYGDIYPCNSEWGFCIVSGDELALEAACHAKATLVVFVTDVDGIYDSEMKLIRKIHIDCLESLIGEAKDVNKGIDVTGGMERKLTAIKKIKCTSLKHIIVVNGLKKDLLYRALKNEDVPLTLIEL